MAASLGSQPIDAGIAFNWTYRSASDSEFEPIDLIIQPNKSSDIGPATGWPKSAIAVGLGCLSAMTILGSLVSAFAVRYDLRMHHTSYYFSVSMALLHAVMASAVMPPAVIVTWQGEYRCSDALCKLWITADLFFCNNTCLHLAFMNMDTFLRLKDPLRHGRNVTACSLLLWLGAPWAVSLVQSVAQFMLSQADADSRARPGLCFIADKNFVILGTLFSFVIPSVVAVSFAALCRHEIRTLRCRVFCSTGLTSGSGIGSTGAVDCLGGGGGDGGRISVEEDLPATDFDYDESLNASDSSCSGESDNRSEASVRGEVDGTSVVTEQVQLEVVIGGGGEDGDRARRSFSGGIHESSVDSNYEETTAFCTDDMKDRQARSPLDGSLSYNGLRPVEHTISRSALLLRESGFHDPADVRLMSGDRSVVVDDFRNIPDQTLRHELTISRLAVLMMIVHITLWLPLSVSNVVYGVCQPCRESMTFAHSVALKWLAYSSAAIGMIVCTQFSELMRQAVWNVLRCRYCRLRHRTLP